MLRRFVISFGLALTASATFAFFSNNVSLHSPLKTTTKKSEDLDAEWEVEYVDGSDQPFTPGSAGTIPKIVSRSTSWLPKAAVQSGPKKPARSNNPSNCPTGWSSKPNGG